MKTIGCSIPSLLPALAIVATTLLAPLGAKAETSIVVDVDTGKVLSQKDATVRWYPASTTKLMTAYLALKAMRDEKMDLDSPVIVTRRAAAQAPSKMGFQPGSVIRLDNALRMMLVKSANDIAVAVGQAVADGSFEKFVAMMNAEAARLGMKDTHFINPNGLPGEGQYSSAKDLAILATAIRRDFPAFSDYFGTEAISTGSATMKNGNKLLGRFDGADGMKTGYICASGFNLVSSATRDGRTIVAVVLGADGPITRERTAAELLENGFKTDPATVAKRVDELPVSSGAPMDISDEICSAEGRTGRANERAAEAKREEPFGSPYMHEMERSPVVVAVGLGGAAGSDIAEPGISVISAYGIPIPTFRPSRPEDILATPPTIGAPGEEAQQGESIGAGAPAAASPTADAAGVGIAEKSSRVVSGSEVTGLRPGAGMPDDAPAASAAN